jgi:protein arginine N-methyltransferase 1
LSGAAKTPLGPDQVNVLLFFELLGRINFTISSFSVFVDRMDDSDYYFDSYSGFEVHEVMLKDRVRTTSYRTAIYGNPSLIRDSVVLDVGCGTGILSLFAANAGARRVYAVDNSSMSEHAKVIIAHNGFSEFITVIHGRMEDVQIPEKVDVIVSEWMGYGLLYESMLPSVISARDRFMKPSGTMFPNRAKLFVTGLEDPQYVKRKFGFWDDICGFNLGVIKEFAIREGLVEAVPTKNLVTDDSMIVEFDLNKVTVEELNVDAPFSITPLEDSVLNGFVLWFEVYFDGPEAQVTLSTSPFKPETHWGQSIFYLPEPVELETDVQLTGRIVIRPNARNYRDQDVTITFEYADEQQTHSYKMK